MALLDIVLYPDEPLTKVAAPVERFDEELRQLVNDMVETMYANDGLGLAAPQVGVSRRIVVIDYSDREQDEEPKLLVMINPRIEHAEGSIRWEEGCLSLPGLFREVQSHAVVDVVYQDVDGNPQRIHGEELLAVALQHEIDHLNGILFIDRLGPLKKRFALKEWKRLRAEELARRSEGRTEERGGVEQ
ncbi:MAG: peptide deformylase [Myxococcota bacterium]|jgi:peptide deformylase|nr:peptide deformylase [Myxococcota bacterium]